ncbi:MAG: Stress response protein nst1 [Trizodia sp. TS-e1964]|nr:MAG: Stress response protein nst1 [Trizodia sp. TS-e1964]
MPSKQTRSNNEEAVSPSSKSTATYTNKDGSKFITVKKTNTEPSITPASDLTQQEQSAAKYLDMAQGTKRTNGAGDGHLGNNASFLQGALANQAGVAGVNRKKQKRRQKQAARLAAEQQVNGDSWQGEGYTENGEVHHHPRSHRRSPSFEEQNYDQDNFDRADGEELYYSEDDGQPQYDPNHSHTNGHSASAATKKKQKKKKKGKPSSTTQDVHDAQSNRAGGSSTSLSTPSASLAPPPPPPPPPPLSATSRQNHGRSDRIWNTSTQEERERIKDFWLSLGEEDRRSLVKVEKEAVLRKMKEQQKHSCSCTVCGRKRTAIEEELEVLYDAYYDELEQYANHQQGRTEDGPPIMPPPGRYPQMPRYPADRSAPLMSPQQHVAPSRGRILELADEEEDEDEDEEEEDADEDEEYSDEEEAEEEYSDEEPEGEEPRGPAADFFTFGNSLTVQGGILTVADDLLKNDGKKFIEMMEQLAERRMQREEEAQYASSGTPHAATGGSGQHNHSVHNHAPPPDEEEYDDEEDDDYDSQEEEDYEDDEMETMTEEQRMEEGRRMFQIFAARMFEQRVLTAYREKVAQERQKKLLEELEEESRRDVERDAKRAKEAQKKKDKKKMQKQAKEEEKAKRDAEKAAEEAAAKAIEEKKAEDQRLKREEQRRKREAEKKALEEERLKKEADKQRRLQEDRNRQAELERKQREQKEREKKKKEDFKRREREEREAKEKQAREKREREEKEKNDREARLKSEREGRERAKREELLAQQSAAKAAQTAITHSKRSLPPISVPGPPGLHVPHHPVAFPSPRLQISTPAIPKAPTPIRTRQQSQQGSVGSSPRTPLLVPGPGHLHSPALPTHHQNAHVSQSGLAKLQTQSSSLHHPQPDSPMPLVFGQPPIASHSTGSAFPSISPMDTNGSHSSQSSIPTIPLRTPIGSDIPMWQQSALGSQYRTFTANSNLPNASSSNGLRSINQGRGAFMEGPPGLPQQAPNSSIGIPKGSPFVMPRDTMPSHSHSRQQSVSVEGAKPIFDSSVLAPLTQPIARPAPIQRPASTAPKGDENHRLLGFDIDDLSSHLGSSALLDDSDDQFLPDSNSMRQGISSNIIRPSRLGFGSSPFFPEPAGQTKLDTFGLNGQTGNTWGAPHLPFGSPSVPSNSTWSHSPVVGWPSSGNTFGVIGGPNRFNLPRTVLLRRMMCQACKQLTNANSGRDGFHDINDVMRQLTLLPTPLDPPAQLKEAMEILETLGDPTNGGGYFTVVRLEGMKLSVKHETDDNVALSGRVNVAPGEIGSPIVGSSMSAFGGGDGVRPYHPPGVVSPSGF